MAHSGWCGEVCSECKSSCELDKSMPCSPDCEAINSQTNEKDKRICDKCDAYVQY